MLWPYLADVDFYRCPSAPRGHWITYSTISAVNGSDLYGVFMSYGTYRRHLGVNAPSNRVGRTVLRLTRLSDIVSPGPAQRTVFIDEGQTPGFAFVALYFEPKWYRPSPPPIQHSKGVTLSLADGHAEYWKWKGSETLTMPRKLSSAPNGQSISILETAYWPQTEDGLYDLQRVQRAAWGRIGYGGEASAP